MSAVLLAMVAEAMAGSYLALLAVQRVGMSPLETNSAIVCQTVASDYFGGVELISAAFQCVMMAVQRNLQDGGRDDLPNRTMSDRSRLDLRYAKAKASLVLAAERTGCPP
jgi:hypothetical protein